MQTNLIFCKFAATDVTEKYWLLAITLGFITITFETSSSITVTEKNIYNNYILLLSHAFVLENLPQN